MPLKQSQADEMLEIIKYHLKTHVVMMEFRLSKILCYILSSIFLLFGFYLLLYPSHLLNFITTALQPGIPSWTSSEETTFWRVLSFAYMMTIASLAFFVAVNITIYWRLLLVLFMAKIASSLSAFGFFLSGGGVLPFTIFITDFPLSLLFLGLYMWIRSKRG